VRHNPRHAVEDEAEVRRLIERNPWATLVSEVDGLPVASHYPVLLDDGADLAVVTHVGRPDEGNHRFGDKPVLVIIAGPHGYVSPSWYAPGATTAPTWNFSTAHLYGTPQLLGAEENLAVLTKLVAHFEQHVESPMWLDPAAAAAMAPGTVGLRIPVDRFVCKIKMSQDKDPVSQSQVLDHLRADGPYQQLALAADMSRALSG
jgi:transcriptional regulator